jgi:hypothetical protein
MNEQVPMNLELDPRFPSGDWTGFFLQYWLPGRHKTDLHLTWRDGTVTGAGHDRVGPFTINGTYDVVTGQCEWTKKYRGKHSVAYRGVNDGRGIWGVWEIRQLGGLYVDRGGFHIWPWGSNVSEESEHTERAVLAAMKKEFGGRSSPLHPIAAVLFLAVVLGLAFLAWWKLSF